MSLIQSFPNNHINDTTPSRASAYSSTKVTELVNERVNKANVAINVKDYGAVGDGVTDDTVAIKNALTAANTNNVPVYVPSGEYLVQWAQLRVEVTSDNFTLYGDGKTDSVLRFADDHGQDARHGFILVQRNTNIHPDVYISDIGFVYENDSVSVSMEQSSTLLLLIGYFNNILVDNTYVHIGGMQSGLPNDVCIFWHVDANSVVVSNCLIENFTNNITGGGIWVMPDVDGTPATINQCTIRDNELRITNQDEAIGVYTSAGDTENNLKDVTICNNTITHKSWNGQCHFTNGMLSVFISKADTVIDARIVVANNKLYSELANQELIRVVGFNGVDVSNNQLYVHARTVSDDALKVIRLNNSTGVIRGSFIDTRDVESSIVLGNGNSSDITWQDNTIYASDDVVVGGGNTSVGKFVRNTFNLASNKRLVLDNYRSDVSTSLINNVVFGAIGLGQLHGTNCVLKGNQFNAGTNTLTVIDLFVDSLIYQDNEGAILRLNSQNYTETKIISFVYTGKKSQLIFRTSGTEIEDTPANRELFFINCDITYNDEYINDAVVSTTHTFSSNKVTNLLTEKEPTIEASIFTELGKYSIGANMSTGTQNGCCYDSASHKFYYTQKVNGILHIYEVDFTDAEHPTLSRDCVTTLDTITIPVGGLTGTGVCILGNYLFASYRSSEPNVPSTGMNNDDIWGALVCVELTNFTEVWVKTFNAKCSCVRTYVSGNKIYLALACQMSYIQFYSVNSSDYSQITLEDTQYFEAYNTVSGWTDYIPTVQECQQGCFYETEDNRVLYVAAGFGDGVHIFDITDVQSGVKRATLYNWSVLSNAPDWWRIQGMGHHTFDCVVNYPYVYATMAGSSTMCNYEIEHGVTLRNDGIVVLNISDLEHITAECFPMNKSDLCTFSGGDPRPNTIAKVGNYAFLGNGDKGVAIYDVSSISTPVYICSLPIPYTFDIYKVIGTDDGLLIGDYPDNQSSGSPQYIAPKYVVLDAVNTSDVYNIFNANMQAIRKELSQTDDIVGEMADCFDNIGKPVSISLFNDIAPTTSSKGITYSVSNDVLDLSGTCTGGTFSLWTEEKIPRGTYTLSWDNVVIRTGTKLNNCAAGYSATKSGATYIAGNFATSGFKTFTMDEDSYIRIAVFADNTEDGSLRLWLNEGDTPHTYNKDSIKLKPDAMQELIDDSTSAHNKVYSSSKVEALIDAIQIGDPDALPSFYEAEYDDTIQKIQQLAFASSDSFAFGFTSDLHFCTKDSQFSDTDKDRLRSGVTRMMRAFGKFTRQYPLATTIIGGDFAYFYDNSIKQNDVDNIMEIGEWMSKFDGNRIVFRGNHEYKYSGSSGESAGLDIDEFYDICSRKYITGKIEKISKTVYCQIDDADEVCFIYINALFAPILDSTLKSELRAVFAKNTNSYPYIISTHYGMENKVGAPAYIVDGTKYVIDFVKTNSGPIIAWIAGHAHADWHGVYNDTLIMTTISAGYYSNKVAEDGNTYTKVLNTKDESAFSIYTVDKAMGKLYCTRFGAGVDRVFHYNDYSGAIGSATDYAYSITQNLTGVTSDFTKTGTDSDATIHLTPDNVGDTLNVTVLMGSTDVTSTVWDSSTGYVTITGATDNITITATSTVGVIVLLDVEHADSVVPYNNNGKATVSTIGNDFTCSITSGGGGAMVVNSVKPSWAQFTNGKTATYKCDSYTCDISGNFLPGYINLQFFANGTSIGYQSSFVSPVSNILEALQAMSTTGLTVQHNGYWGQADTIRIELRTSTNGGTAIDPPFTLNVTNLRLELDA